MKRLLYNAYRSVIMLLFVLVGCVIGLGLPLWLWDVLDPDTFLQRLVCLLLCGGVGIPTLAIGTLVILFGVLVVME